MGSGEGHLHATPMTARLTASTRSTSCFDLVIAHDLSPRWKDEDEYAQCRRLGIVSDAEHRQVQQAREQVIGLFEQPTGPFEDRWQAWRPDPSWRG
jgi:hypothetical protein